MKKLNNGVYILTVTNSLIPYNELSKHIFDEANMPQFVILVTEYGAIKIDKKIIGSFTYNEAIKYDLPDTIQGHQIGLNRDILKPVIEAISGEWSDSWFWTRSECNSNSSWFYYGSYGFLDFSGKGSSISVRPVTAFQLSSLNFKTPKEAKSLRKK